MDIEFMDYFVSQAIPQKIRSYVNNWIVSQRSYARPFAEPGQIRDMFIEKVLGERVGIVLNEYVPPKNGIIRIQTPIEFATEMKNTYEGNVEVVLFVKGVVPSELESITDIAFRIVEGQPHEQPKGMRVR
jgi:hypothetical protein